VSALSRAGRRNDGNAVPDAGQMPINHPMVASSAEGLRPRWLALIHGANSLSGPITVKIKRLPDGDGLPLPSRMSAEAAGFDVPAAVTEPVVLQPGEIRLIPCGFAMAVPPGYEAQVRPRSGLASKFGISLINTPGTI